VRILLVNDDQAKGANMRSIDDILSAAQKAMAASLHEAYEAGRAHTATELKARMAAFFDGLVAESESHAAHTETPPANDSHRHDHQHHDDHQHHNDHQHHD
jgi:hypothetical protein